ncbi:MAG: hypothetical protein EXQ70_05265 [Solirubrobacterales bacterium]|nr:hypothetical protein [Solirubrobacterales bacterium]
MHRIRTPLIASFALLICAGLVACGGGGGGGGDEDPQQVLDQTFNNDQQVSSGSFDLGLKVDIEGGTDPGSLDASLGGPFQSEKGGVPKFDLNADFSFDSDNRNVDFTGGATSTGDAAFIDYKDTEYELPAQLFDTFEQRYVQIQRQSDQQAGNDSSPLKALGIDPSTWLKDVSNEGDEEVDGADTIHVHGEADVPELVADLRKAAEKTGQAQQIDPAQLSALEDIVKSAEFDIYSGTDDHILRRLDANLELVPPSVVPGAPDSVKVELSLNISDVNEDQTIEEPSDAKSLNELFSELGVSSDQIQGALGGAGAGAGSGSPQAGGSPSGPASDEVQGYLDCLQGAQGSEAVQDCAEQYGIGQ